MDDIVEEVNGSVIQHGHHNDRIYLMRLNPELTSDTLVVLDTLAREKGYGKVFARIPPAAWPAFKKAGYRKEAVIPGFYQGRMDGLFVARYYAAARRVLMPPDALEPIPGKFMEYSSGKKAARRQAPPSPVVCKATNASEMSNVFQQVFESYPFPIHNPDYLKQVMAKGVVYYCIRVGGALAALAATEIDPESETVEMTDFATLRAWRNSGMATALLSHMEPEARKLGLKTAYTIARAASQGINRLFKNNGYQYAGLLVNNTQICGRIQSMAVWYKQL